jgi:hypothetical protein
MKNFIMFPVVVLLIAISLIIRGFYVEATISTLMGYICGLIVAVVMTHRHQNKQWWVVIMIGQVGIIIGAELYGVIMSSAGHITNWFAIVGTTLGSINWLYVQSRLIKKQKTIKT